MSRDNIVNKSSDPPKTVKSEWFGYKYKVNPETSKLLQEAVFKDGGSWFSGKTYVQRLEQEILKVTSDGEIFLGYKSLDEIDLPEKQPPQPSVESIPYQFKVGDRVKIRKDSFWYGGCKNSNNPTDMVGDIYRVGVEDDAHPIKVKWNNTEANCYTVKDLELVLDKEDEVVENISVPQPMLDHKHLGNVSKQTSIKQEETNMTQVTTRKTVTVNLIDRDSALDEKHSVVANFGEFTTSKSSEALIRSIIIDPSKEVAKLIEQHNEVRIKQTNKEILNRTGNKVTLEPVEESDLYWEIS